MTRQQEKLLAWIGNSKRDLMALPVEVRKFFGHALDFAQRGEQHGAVKVLKSFGGAGVLEIVEDDRGGTYRAVYTVKFREAVFVLHVFKKRARAAFQHPSLTWTLSANA
jgi:phage-related protein